MAQAQDEVLEEDGGESLSPAMRKLSPKRRKFVEALLAQGPKWDATRAAQEAGFGGANRKALSVTAHRIRHHPDVAAAIVEALNQRIDGYSFALVEMLFEIATDSATRDQDKIKAAAMLLDRSLPVQTTHNVRVSHEPNRREQIRDGVAAAIRLGLDPREALGGPLDEVQDLELIESRPSEVQVSKPSEPVSNLDFALMARRDG